jgi:glycosyltransferase involved in cell wall biosynthesis
MTFHVVGLPYAPTTHDRATCPFVGLTLRFCQMMKSLGHRVFHYGVEGSDETICTEHVSVMSQGRNEEWFGKHDPNSLPRVDWTGKAAYWTVFHERVAGEIRKRLCAGDFVCLLIAQNACLIEMLPKDVFTVAYAIGHDTPFARYRVYASYSNMHRFLGVNLPSEWYHVVIPHYFDVNEFPLVEKKSNYYVYMGRLMKVKGFHVAVELARAAGVKLMVAGPGATYTPGQLTCEAGIFKGDIAYLGCVSGAERAKVLGEARACIVPSLCTEGFGNVAVEAQLTGTPVICTDWGGMTETVEHGKTGYRCRTWDQFLAATRRVHTLDPQYICRRAIQNYSMMAVRWRYEEYFATLQDLRDPAGWYAVHPEKYDRHPETP